MKWLKSTTQKAYTIDGKTVPPCVTKENNYLSLSEKDYMVFMNNKIVASLVKAGAILVTDKEPSSPTKQNSILTTQNALLIKENTELKEQLKEAQNNDTTAAELATVKAELEALQAKYEALEEEAKETIADLQAQLESVTATEEEEE